MPTEIEKIQGHASHLLDSFINLRQKYAMLKPMLHNKSVVETKGSKQFYMGFNIIKNTLFLSCAQDIANICSDKYPNSLSIKNLISKLENEALRNELKDIHSIPSKPINDDEDPQIIEIIKQMLVNERIELREQFDKNYLELQTLWIELSTSAALEAFTKIRKKVAAHTDVIYTDNEYKLLDIKSLNLKWEDIPSTISAMQKIVNLLNLIIRNAGYAWEYLDELLDKKVNDYWEITPTSQQPLAAPSA